MTESARARRKRKAGNADAIRARVQELLAQAPPLTDDQRIELQLLMHTNAKQARRRKKRGDQ